MEMNESGTERKVAGFSPWDHYTIEGQDAEDVGAATVGELRSKGCPICGEEMFAVSTCNKDLSTYVRLGCLGHGGRYVFELSQKGGKAVLAEIPPE